MQSIPSHIDAQAYLVVQSQVFPIKKEVTTIGRKLENDLVIQDPLVSRCHAEIHRIGDAYKIIDQNSTSGTYINKLKVTECTLYSGDIILIANIPLMFVNQGSTIKEQTKLTTSSLFRMSDNQENDKTQEE